DLAAGAARILNADVPRSAVFEPREEQIAAGCDHEVAEAVSTKDFNTAIDREAFANPAQIDAHPLPLQEHASSGIVHHQRSIVDQWKTAPDVVHVWQEVVPIVAKSPKARQHAEGHVELAAGPLADLRGGSQNAPDFGSSGHGMIAGGSVDLLDVASRLPDADHRFEPIELGE